MPTALLRRKSRRPTMNEPGRRCDASRPQTPSVPMGNSSSPSTPPACCKATPSASTWGVSRSNCRMRIGRKGAASVVAEFAAQAGCVLIRSTDVHVAVVILRQEFMRQLPPSEVCQSRMRYSPLASTFSQRAGSMQLRGAEGRPVAGKAAQQRVGAERERRLHGRMAVDGILDVDAAAPAGKGRRLGQRGEGTGDGSQPAIAAGRVQGNAAVDDRRPTRVDVLPPRRRRREGADVRMPGRAGLTLDVRRHFRRQVHAAPHRRAGEPRAEILLLEVAE